MHGSLDSWKSLSVGGAGARTQHAASRLSAWAVMEREHKAMGKMAACAFVILMVSPVKLDVHRRA
jgi:hypothetical protein